MDSRLFEIDPYASVSYGLYNSFKGNKGSFEDFLLHYDSSGANKGKNEWLTKLVEKSTLEAVSSPEVFEAQGVLGIHDFSFLNKSSFFDTQINAYKLQLMDAFSKREDYKNTMPLLKQLLA